MSEPKTYKCPECGGVMHFFAGNDYCQTYVCEICQGMYMKKVREKLTTVKVGKSEIYTDNQEVANILKKGCKT